MHALLIALGDGAVIAKRNLIKVKRVPDILVFTILSPIMFVLLFAYVFGNSIDVPGVNYREFLIAGIFAQTVLFGSAYTGVGLADDIQKGIIDRFRSLPMARSAVLVGRTTSDLVNNLIVMAVMIVVGLLVGWRTSTGMLSVLFGFVLLLLFSYAFSWISATIGLTVKSVEVANSAGFIWMFPLTFISNIFIDISQLPTVFRVIAEWNPISALVGATRELFGNTSDAMEQSSAWPVQNPLAASILWIAVLLAVFIPLSIRQYKKAASR